MTAKDFDQNGRRFWGGSYFPYGLSRSGEFTFEQVRLLENHFYAYEALAKGERSPVTPAESDFVSFCLGNKDAESNHEKAWKLFCEKTSRSQMSFTLGAPAVSSDDSDADSSLEDVGDDVEMHSEAS